MSLTQWTLAIGCISAAAAVLVVMLRRNLRSRFPFFFNYVVLYLACACLDLAAYFYGCRVFYHLSWVLGSLLMVMEFAVIYEVLANTLRSYSALVDLAKILFRWAALFLLVVGLITAFATAGHEVSRWEAALNVIQHSIRLMQCGLLLFLLVFENRLGISWRSHGVAIAMGIGVYASVNLTISYVTIPWISARVLDAIDGSVYLAALTGWACLLALREPASKSLLDTPSRLIFQRWNEALMVTPLVSARQPVAAFSPVESFLPGVERTVERVMARKMH